MKIYFFYFPLVFVGYALIRDESDLRRFLLVSMVLAGIVSALGIIQAIVGPDFLNPATLAPQIRELGALRKVAPLTNEVFLLPSSVFVSSGRFGFYLTLVAIEGLGAIGYFVLAKARGRSIILVSIGLVAAAVLLSGSRGTLLYASISSVVLTLLFLWGAPWRLRQTHRLIRAIRNAVAFAALSLIFLVLLFPRTVASRWAFYTETLSPESSVSQFDQRVWNYPMRNFFDAFSEPHWIMGNGIGTASLGIQYVAELLKQPTPSFWVEEGFGQLIVELGILGPFLWIVWTAALLWASWKAVRPLKQTRFFPIAMAILWYSFVLLYPMVYGGLDPFENYVNNAFLWILVGILFRLPEMASPSPLAFVSAERSEAIARV